MNTHTTRIVILRACVRSVRKNVFITIHCRSLARSLSHSITTKCVFIHSPWGTTKCVRSKSDGGGGVTVAYYGRHVGSVHHATPTMIGRKLGRAEIVNDETPTRFRSIPVCNKSDSVDVNDVIMNIPKSLGLPPGGGEGETI